MFLFEDESEEMEQNLFKFRTRIGNTVTRFAIFLIAFIMIAYGLNAMYTIIQLQDDESWVRWANLLIEIMGWSDREPLHMSRFLRLPGAIFFIVGGCMILLDVRRTFVRSVGLYALAMGVNRICTVLPFLAAKEDISNGIGTLFLVLGCNLIYSGYSMLSGSVRGKWGLIASSAFFTVVYLMLIGMFVNLYIIMPGEYSWIAASELLEAIYAYLISFLMYFLLLWLLDTDQIRYGDRFTRHISILRNIDNTYRAAELLTLSYDDAAKLRSEYDWVRYDHDNGPVERELRLISDTIQGRSYLTFQKWYDCDTLYLTLSPYENGTLTYAQRIRIAKILDGETPDELYLLSDPGEIYHVTITDREVSKEAMNDALIEDWIEEGEKVEV